MTRATIRRGCRVAVLGLATVLTAATAATACSSSGSRRSAGPSTTAQGSGRPAASSVPSSAPVPVGVQAITEAWRLPAAVSRPVVLPDGGDFVVLGGLSTGDTSTARIVRVDPSSGQSVVAGRLGTAVHDSAGAVIGGRWFVFGGGSYRTVALIQAWSTGTASAAGSLPDARSDLSATTVGGTTYIVGGFDGTTMTQEVLATSDGVSFRTVARLAVPVRYAAVAGLDGALWVVGGVTGTSEGATEETDAIQKVDLATGRTTVAGRLAQAMGHASAVVLGGSVFVLGGRAGSVPSSAIWRIDQATGEAVAAGHLPEAVSDAGAVAVGGVGYLIGGEITGPAAPLDTVVALHPA